MEYYMYVPPFGEVRIPFQPNCGVDLLIKVLVG